MKKTPRRLIFTFFETAYGVLSPFRQEQTEKTHQAYKTFRAKSQAQRSASERLADFITGSFGSITFAGLHVLWFAGWLLINLGYVPSIPVFDPFPFGLLTMVVSLEAIFLSLFVLISQNREGQVSNLREEVDFQITMQAEQEITRLLQMTYEIHEHLGLAKGNDKQLEEMKKMIDTEQMQKDIEKEMKSA